MGMGEYCYIPGSHMCLYLKYQLLACIKLWGKKVLSYLKKNVLVSCSNSYYLAISKTGVNYSCSLHSSLLGFCLELSY